MVQLDKSARNYAKAEEIRKMINFYMMETGQMSDSLIKGHWNQKINF
jgi:hypothetical protein